MMNKKQKNIPNGWRLAKIGEIGNIVSGGTPSTEILEYWGGEIPWITPTEITKLKTKYIFDTERKITKLGLEKSSAKEIPPMSLIICSRATVGKCAINRKLVTTNQGFKNIVPNKNINIYFLYYYIYTQSNQLKRISSGSTFLEFSKFDLEKFKFLLPPLPEQNKIVQILETWDDYLEKITKKIEIKKSIKKGLMQKLLRGVVRFKGYTDELDKVQVGKLLNYEQPTNYIVDSTEYNDEYEIPVLTAGKTFILGYTNEDKGIFDKEKLPVIIFDDFTTAIKFVNFPFKVKSSAMKILKNKNSKVSNINFIFESIKMLKFKVGEHKRNYLSEYQYLDINLPTIEEQNAIADMITIINREIEVLENKKKIIEDQKRYLLNNLITGKIRIPEFEKVK